MIFNFMFSVLLKILVMVSLIIMFSFFFNFPFLSNTSGVKCTWSGGGYLEIDLHHCTDPVNYHVYVNAPSKGISKNVTLKQGDDKELSKHFKIHVTQLSRKGNQVTATVSFTSVAVECKLLLRL